MAFLRELKRLHHLLGLPGENIPILRVKLPCRLKNSSKCSSLILGTGRKLKRARSRPEIPARELLRNSLGNLKNVPRVFVVILHERFASGERILLLVAELARDSFLQVQVQHIGRALV